MKHWVGLIGIGCWGCFIPYGEIYAKDLGVQGSVYAIGEQDALLLIEKRLNQMQESGEIEVQQQKLKNQMLSSVERPQPVRGLKLTEKPRTFERDLTLTVPFDIHDAEGKIIQKAGTKINPLTKVFTKKSLLFFDGDSEPQLQWALQEHNNKNVLIKLVLINGSPLALMRQYDIPFYFDQGGRLSQYFKLEQIPARVSQKQGKLLIEEIKL